MLSVNYEQVRADLMSFCKNVGESAAFEKVQLDGYKAGSLLHFNKRCGNLTGLPAYVENLAAETDMLCPSCMVFNLKAFANFEVLATAQSVVKHPSNESFIEYADELFAKSLKWDASPKMSAWADTWVEALRVLLMDNFLTGQTALEDSSNYLLIPSLAMLPAHTMYHHVDIAKYVAEYTVAFQDNTFLLQIPLGHARPETVKSLYGNPFNFIRVETALSATQLQMFFAFVKDGMSGFEAYSTTLAI